MIRNDGMSRCLKSVYQFNVMFNRDSRLEIHQHSSSHRLQQHFHLGENNIWRTGNFWSHSNASKTPPWKVRKNQADTGIKIVGQHSFPTAKANCALIFVQPFHNTSEILFSLSNLASDIGCPYFVSIEFWWTSITWESNGNCSRNWTTTNRSFEFSETPVDSRKLRGDPIGSRCAPTDRYREISTRFGIYRLEFTIILIIDPFIIPIDDVLSFDFASSAAIATERK